MAQLKGKTALITGASRGIGKSIATRLAKEGINLCLAARTKGPLDATVEELKKTYGVDVIGVQTDVGKLEDLKNLEAKNPLTQKLNNQKTRIRASTIENPGMKTSVMKNRMNNNRNPAGSKILNFRLWMIDSSNSISDRTLESYDLYGAMRIRYEHKVKPISDNPQVFYLVHLGV